VSARWLAALATLTVGTTVLAEPVPEDPVLEPLDIHWGMAAVETAISLGIPTIWYWTTEEHQQIDYSLGGDWSSWKLKFTSTEKIKWDTNQFHINAIRHPLGGAIDYQIARSNGVRMLGSTVFAALKGAFWEYFIEFREAPSLNDLLLNASAGVSIGEPLYQLGQLWRGPDVTWADRARTAMFSPFDALHDTYRSKPRRWRPRAWREIDLGAGAMQRRADGADRGELAVGADLDLVNEPAYVTPGEHDVHTRAGAWSRFRIGARVGDVGNGSQLVGTEFRTSTSFFGRYTQSATGVGLFVGLGTAFTYRNDTLAIDKDRLAIAHLLGPQLSLITRGNGLELRLDAAAYADFGLAQAMVFSPNNPFPRPPPYYTSLQSDGYIDAFGVTGTTRLRARKGSVRAELEVMAHGLWQTVGHDREEQVAAMLAEPASTAYGLVELRALWRGQLGYDPGGWGAALVVDGAQRKSTWARGGLERSISDYAIGALLTRTY